MWAKFRQLWHKNSLSWMTTPTIAGIVILIRFLGLLQSWEWGAYDLYIRLRPTQPTDDRIVIVGIQESDLKYLNQGYISDGIYAELINKLKAMQPRAIGLDIYRDYPFEPGHQELVKVFESTEYLRGIEKVVPDRSGQPVAPPPALKAKGQVGANDVIPDADNTVRRGFIYLANQEGENIFTFGFHLALIYLKKEGIEPEPIDGKRDIWRIGKTVFYPLTRNHGSYIRSNNKGYQILINYQGKTGSFQQVSLQDILEDRVAQDWGKDRIILIGAVGESFNDLFYTPYSSSFLDIPEQMPGVEVQANLISQILTSAIDHNSLIHSLPEYIEWLWILLWSGIGTILASQWPYLKSRKSLLLRWLMIPFSAGSVLLISTYLALVNGWWLPVVPPFLAMLGSGIVITFYIAHTAKSIRRIFGRYLTDEVVATLLETADGLTLGGHRQKITVITSDLRGFTAISERYSPEEVIQMINIYLESMLDILVQYQGNINNFLGDGLLILFGCPLSREDDAVRAVACAVAMQLAMNDVNHKLEQLGFPSLEMGIGINTGEVILGNIGSEKHTQYSVLGSEVNLAFRIETYSIGGQILISQATLNEVGESVLTINNEKIVKPKGVKREITIYEISGIRGKYNLFLPEEKEIFCSISQELSILYFLLDGKQLSDVFFKGSIIKLSAKGAEIRVENEDNPIPSPLSNIKLNLFNRDQEELAEISEDIYAKVLDKYGSPETFYIRFTFKPPVVAKILFKTLSKSIKEN
jgi:adenylate cyclase